MSAKRRKNRGRFSKAHQQRSGAVVATNPLASQLPATQPPVPAPSVTTPAIAVTAKPAHAVKASRVKWLLEGAKHTYYTLGALHYSLWAIFVVGMLFGIGWLARLDHALHGPPHEQPSTGSVAHDTATAPNTGPPSAQIDGQTGPISETDERRKTSAVLYAGAG